MDYYHDNWGSLFFSGFRSLPFPTLYPENKTAVTVDVLEVGWIVAFITLALSLYIIVIGQPKSWLIFVRVTVTLIIGLIIMMCNFGQEWEVGRLTTHTAYRAGTATEIDAHIGVKLGLRSVNITLKAAQPPTNDLVGEKIDYNERFSWTWSQGRFGFGPTAGRIQREFRQHQWRGTPYPILWIAEYFTFDGEGIRFGRHYRYAGWYAHICIWAALPAWLLTVVLFRMIVSYGAMMLGLTGACLTTAAILWATIRNRIELAIPFDPPEKILTTHFGVHWYLALIVGVTCMFSGILIFLLNLRYPDELCYILGINPTDYLDVEYEEYKAGVDNPQASAAAAATSSDDIEMDSVGQTTTWNRTPSIAMRFRGRGTSKWKTTHITAESGRQVPYAPTLPRPPPPSTVPPAHLHTNRHPHEYPQQPPTFRAPPPPNIEVTQYVDNVAPPDFDLGGSTDPLYQDLAHQYPGQEGHAGNEPLYRDVAPQQPDQEGHVEDQPLYANLEQHQPPARPWQ